MIKNILKGLGYNLTHIANKIGISRQALYNRLDGEMTVTSLKEIVDTIDYKVVIVPKFRVLNKDEYEV